MSQGADNYIGPNEFMNHGRYGTLSSKDQECFPNGHCNLR